MTARARRPKSRKPKQRSNRDEEGEYPGRQLNENGGIEVHVDAEKSEGVPEENWLPINRNKDEEMGIVLHANDADLDKLKSWQAPVTRKLSQ